MKNIIMMGTILLLNLLASCKGDKEPRIENPIEKIETESPKLIDASDFEEEINGAKTGLYTIRNQNGLRATFTNYGQRLVSLYVPGRSGEMEDVVLGFSSLERYRSAKEKYFGATIGRYGNRISRGRFSLGGKIYQLETNNGENHLHGGTGGFHNVVWKAEQNARNQLVFSRTSPHMEEGYPGNLKVKVVYTLTDQNELKINYEAESDRNTIVNLTHHSFFNLAGAGDGQINDHILMINGDHYTPVDAGLIPTGEINPVVGTPFDFTKPKAIGQDLESEHQQLRYGQGYDHNWVLNLEPKNQDGLVLAARVVEPISGRTMEVYTNEPGLQFYGGNFLDGKTVGKGGEIYSYRGAFCLETQHFPDSPNQPSFPEVTLDAGEVYKSTCVYKFGVEG